MSNKILNYLILKRKVTEVFLEHKSILINHNCNASRYLKILSLSYCFREYQIILLKSGNLKVTCFYNVLKYVAFLLVLSLMYKKQAFMQWAT